MYLKIKDLSVYFQKTGKGKALIMLHGWGQDVSTFWNVVDLLKDKYTVYLIDFPGFGRSDTPRHPYSISDYAEVVKEFILREKLKKPVILGHSLGGRVAIRFASRNSDLIDKLILESSAGVKPKRDIFKFLLYVPAKAFNYFFPNIFNLKSKLRYKFYKKLEADYINAGNLRDTLKKILDEDLTEDLKKINSETLLIWGEKDPTKEASLSNGKRMYQLINNSRIEVLEDVGHFPHLEKPERFAYYVKDFS